MQEQVAVFVILILGKVIHSTGNPCHNYKILPRDSQRSQNYTLLSTDINNLPCDDVIDGWYRFGSGEIATSCVPTNHCGTMSTIWMKDSVPNIGETRVNEFCVNHKTGSNPNPCCLFSLHVNVTNCDGYMVYYFKGSNFLCPAGYCTGDLKSCPVGETSNTGFEPCNGVGYPAMFASPVLQAPVIINNGHDFSQTCDINYNGSLSDVAFTVTWLFDGAPYKTVTLTHGVTSTSLTSADWTGKVGKKLSCSVDSYYVSQGPSNHSQILTSTEFNGNLQIIPRSTSITEGEHGTLRIMSTLPLVCSNVSLDMCELIFDVSTTGGDTDRIFFEDGCSVVLSASNWDPVNHKLEVKTKLATVIDPMLNADQYFKLSFTIRRSNVGSHVFNQNRTFEVNITTHDVKHHYCMVLGATEFVGLLKTKSYTAERYTGDLLIYKDTNKSGKVLQVQIRTWRQSVKQSTVCGVAFQYGDTLIKVDMCTIHPNMTAPVVTQGESDDGDVKFYICGSNYEIVTADGVRLSILINSQHLDLKLHIPPAFDNHQIEGACGFNKTWDRLTFLEQKLYGLSKEASLFEEAASPFYVHSSSVNFPVSYCQCGGTTPTCHPFQLLRDPASPILVDNTGKRTIKQGCTVVVPHEINPETVGKESLYTPGDHQTFLHTSGYQNFKTCDEAIKHHSNQFCMLRYRTKEFFFRNICTKDTLSTRNLEENLASAVQGFHWWCQEEALSHPASYYSGIIPLDVTSDMCSSLCSLRGTCYHGTCVCDSGYEGVDCSVNKTAPPVILGIKGGSVCALSNLYCLNPILITRNVYPGDKLQVLLKATDVLSSASQHEMFYLEPVYDNKYSISLPMMHTIESLKLKDKTALKLTLKITNDATIYSNPYDYFVYDDKCQLCEITDTCVQKENTCRINGKCYMAMEANPVNSSQLCDPDKAMIHWTQADKAVTSPETQQVPIVGKK